MAHMLTHGIKLTEKDFIQILRSDLEEYIQDYVL